jgi:hypothetical protein
VPVLFESVCFLFAEPEQANIAKAERINNHFIYASYEIASCNISEKCQRSKAFFEKKALT